MVCVLYRMLEWMICRTVRDKFRALSMEKSDKAMPVDVEGDPMIVQTTTTTSVTSAKSNAKAKAGTNGVMIKIFANSLFELYTTKLRHNGVETFLVASMLFNGFAVADMLGSTSGECSPSLWCNFLFKQRLQSTVSLVRGADCVVYAQSTFLAVNVLLLISAKLLGRFVGLSRVSFGVSLMALTVGVAQFWVHFYYYPLLTPRYTIHQIFTRRLNSPSHMREVKTFKCANRVRNKCFTSNFTKHAISYRVKCARTATVNELERERERDVE